MRVQTGRFGSLRPPPLVRQTSVYTASQLASRAIPFLLLPVLTRYMSPADYGTVTMFMLVAMLLEPFIGIGFAGALTVKYYDRSIDLARYLGTGVALIAGIAVPVALLVFLLREPLSQLTQVPPMWLLLVVPLVVARVIVAAPLALLRVREKAALYGLFQNVQSAALISLALLFVVGLGLAWQGRVAAELLAWSTFAIVGLIWLWRSGKLRFSFDKPYARDLAGFGIPLIPHLLGAILMVQVDRLLLTNLAGVDETGLYTVGYQLALVIELFAVSFNSAYAPWLYRRLTDADDRVRRRLVRYTYVGFAGMMMLALAVAIVMPWLAGQLLDPRYAESARFVPWFAVGFLFSGLYYLVTNYIFYAQRTGWLAVVTITTALINIPLTYVLIKLNGGLGAAQAMAISFGLSFLLTWIVSQRVYPMPWLDRRVIASEPNESDQ